MVLFSKNRLRPRKTDFQRIQKLSKLSDDDLIALANLTDITAFHEMLKPILVERIVDTPTHRGVGEVGPLIAKKFTMGKTKFSKNFSKKRPNEESNFLRYDFINFLKLNLR